MKSCQTQDAELVAEVMEERASRRRRCPACGPCSCPPLARAPAGCGSPAAVGAMPTGSAGVQIAPRANTRTPLTWMSGPSSCTSWSADAPKLSSRKPTGRRPRGPDDRRSRPPDARRGAPARRACGATSSATSGTVSSPRAVTAGPPEPDCGSSASCPSCVAGWALQHHSHRPNSRGRRAPASARRTASTPAPPSMRGRSVSSCDGDRPAALQVHAAPGTDRGVVRREPRRAAEEHRPEEAKAGVGARRVRQRARGRRLTSSIGPSARQRIASSLLSRRSGPTSSAVCGEHRAALQQTARR